MEYTKDIIIPIHYTKKKEDKKKWKRRTSTFFYGKKLVAFGFTLMVFLVGLDLILINSFIQIFSSM